MDTKRTKYGDGKQTARRDDLGQIVRRDGKQIPSSRPTPRSIVSKGGEFFCLDDIWYR